MMGLINQSIRFGMVGLINTAFGLLAIYAILFFLDADPVVANAIGYAIGFVVSFTLNRGWTFSDKRPVMKVFPHYLIVAGGAYLCNLGAVVISARHLGANPYQVQLFGVGIYTTIMFLGCRWFVFRQIDGRKTDLP